MEVFKITNPLYSPRQNTSKLYFKKQIYQRKTLQNSLSNKIMNTKNHQRLRNIPEKGIFSNDSNIRSYIANEEKYNISNPLTTINKPFKTNIKKYLYQNNYKFYKNIKSIILIQKFVRGFIAKKSFKNNHKIIKVNKNSGYLSKNTKNTIFKYINKSSHSNILEAIKQNSFRQKNSIKYINNMLNNNRMSIIEKCKNNNYFINNFKLIHKYKKNFSLDQVKYEDNGYKTFRYINKNNIFTKPVELTDNRKNINNNSFKRKDKNCVTNAKNIPSKPLNDKIKINYCQKKNEKKIETSIDLSDISLSTEQCPQNIIINKNHNAKEDEVIDNEDEEEKNLNINNEYFGNENENKNIIKQLGKNLLHNNKNLNNLYHEKSKKSFSHPYSKILSHMSSNQTKENSFSDKNIENDINYGQDNSGNKNSERTIRSKKEIILDNKKSYKNFNIKKENKQKIECKEKDKNNNQTKSKNSKTNNNINKVNSNCFNHLNFNQIFFVKNNDNNSNKNNLLKNFLINEINNDNKNIINESIKEEIEKEADINDIKSSFYDHEDFAIISYDYSLNDNKKNLAINNVANLIIKGGIKKIKFITILESVIRKNLYHYTFNYFKKKYSKDNEKGKRSDDSSLTINDSCSFVPFKRIERKNIIFEYAKTDIYKKNKNSSNNKSKINIKKNNNNVK